MANEIAITNIMVAAKGSFAYSDRPGTKYVDLATAVCYDEVLTRTTSDTTLALGNIAGADYGLVKFTNLDDTNYIEIGPTASGAIAPMIKLLPGESTGWFRLKPSITLRTQANTASVKLHVQALQN